MLKRARELSHNSVTLSCLGRKLAGAEPYVGVN